MVVTTRTPVVPNTGDYVGIYSDVRGLSTMGDLDNFCIAAAPNGYEFDISDATFSSGEATGTLVGILTATVYESFEDSTFSLVAGEGDTDNALFQIGGATSDELLTNANFTAAGENPADGQTYSIRVQATDVATGNLSTEMILTITVSKDDDLDGLSDEWELRWKEDLTSLSVGNDDDGDGILDDEEYAISLGGFLGLPAYDLNPGSSDTDDDDLADEEELFEFVGSRSQTDPTNPDTDFDGLSDFNETGSGAPETLPLVGTSGSNLDTDGDGAKDGYEIAQGTDPLLDSSVPPSLSASVSVTAITDDASSGISDSKVYTHAISGGYATTVNGVNFEVFDSAVTPANFAWTDPSGKNQIAAANQGDWLPSSGGVTGTQIIDLLSGFTYSNGALPPGGPQSFTLSGLAPGSTYELRIYTRAWSPLDDSGRLIDLTFINGSDAADFTARADLLESAFNTTFWNGNLYQDGASRSHVSAHANFFPMAHGLVPEDRVSAVMEFLKTKRMACSVYGAQYLLEALFEGGEADYAIGLMTDTDPQYKRHWWNMIEEGATISMEAWGQEFKPNQDWNHAWGAVPGNIIPRYVLGLKPLTAGYGEVEIKPQLGTGDGTNGLTSASGWVPTIRGPVMVAVEENSTTTYKLRVDIPGNMTARILVPSKGLPEASVICDGVLVEAAEENGYLVVETMSSGEHVIWLSDTATPQAELLKENWKVFMFGSEATNAAVSGDLLDPDGDGKSTLEEFYANTDPLDSDDHFEVKEMEVDLNTELFELSVPGKRGRQYHLERSLLLEPLQWEIVDTSPILLFDEEVTLIDDSLPDSARAFYRAAVELP